MRNIDQWKKVLNWKQVPQFGPIHRLSEDEFSLFYYIPETVKEVINGIIYSIDEGFGFNNKIIIGEPGSGKTTFVYFLKYILANKLKGLNKYHFEILHVNRLTNSEHHKELIEKRTLVLLRRWFAVNNLSDQFDTLCDSDGLQREKMPRALKRWIACS